MPVGPSGERAVPAPSKYRSGSDPKPFLVMNARMSQNHPSATDICSMSLFALGLNHRTAPVDIRERLAFSPDGIEEALAQLVAATDSSEAAILSTCNRMEIYGCAADPMAAERMVRWLAEYRRFSVEDLTPHLYRFAGDQAVRHTMRVACGLDSMVLGEPQILGQMKDAFQNAAHAGTLGRSLGRLFQYAFSVAKQVRTTTAIGSSPVSVAFAAVRLARQIFGDLSPLTALMIGAGETIELAARHLHGAKIGRLLIANRSLDRAERLASEFGGEGMMLADIGDRLHEADIVISSTASPLPVLGKGTVERALKRRRHRPIFMVDIAVPRDIEPEVGELDDVYLYTVDDLQEVIEEGLQSRREAAGQAEEIIDNEVVHFMDWLRGQSSVGSIRALRDRAEEFQKEVIDKALRQLAAGKPPEEALRFLAHTLTNKLLHTPTTVLNRAAREGRGDIVAAAGEIFDLPAHDRATGRDT